MKRLPLLAAAFESFFRFRRLLDPYSIAEPPTKASTDWKVENTNEVKRKKWSSWECKGNPRNATWLLRGIIVVNIHDVMALRQVLQVSHAWQRFLVMKQQQFSNRALAKDDHPSSLFQHKHRIYYIPSKSIPQGNHVKLCQSMIYHPISNHPQLGENPEIQERFLWCLVVLQLWHALPLVPQRQKRWP